uniref:hypothetical protein n=1 Tax=Candidatus Electronema sp. TaxID=2698783 RepID=UPI004057006B
MMLKFEINFNMDNKRKIDKIKVMLYRLYWPTIAWLFFEIFANLLSLFVQSESKQIYFLICISLILVFATSAIMLYDQKKISAIREMVCMEKIKAKDISFSLKYISALKTNNKLLIFVTLWCTAFLFYFKEIRYRLHMTDNLTDVTFIVLGFNLLLIARELLAEYRIRKGLFGTNRTEARELIDFIIKNSDNLDFTDSNGNLRRALLPEAKDAAEELIPGTFGEEARA